MRVKVKNVKCEINAKRVE